MGRKCCVPGCKSNYRTQKEYTPCFQFPPGRKDLWLNAINRADFQPSPTAVVCVKHFEEKFVIREDRVVRPDGSLLVVPRTKLALKDDAIPTIFEGQPKYLSKCTSTARKPPEERRREVEEREEVKRSSEDKISSYDAFLQLYERKMPSIWQSLRCQGYTVIYLMDTFNCPKITVSLKIYENLCLEIFSSKESKSFKWLLGSDSKCDTWTKFEEILTILSGSRDGEHSLEDAALERLSSIIQLIKKCTDEIEDEDVVNKLKFLMAQMQLILSMNHPRYPPQVLLWSAKLFFSYPAAYYCVRNSNTLVLPHPSYLRKLSQVLTSDIKSNHCGYLIKKAELLEEKEKIVNLLLDEIYVEKCINYKSGSLYGISDNSNMLATTVQSFMITSLFSKNKDVVALFPVNNMTAEELYNYTLKVLELLHNSGYTVLTIISDNNKLNGKMFANLCGGEITCSISNPYCEEQKIFLLFDSVHLLKSIRNNWLNQVATKQKLYFPHPNSGEILVADLSTLKNIHEQEKNSIVKTAPKLSLKVLYPTSIERQNVNLAVNLFHETNIVALKLNPSVLSTGTEYFMDEINKWWSIVNVKSCTKGINKKNEYSNPIENMSCKQVEFLKNFSSWISEYINLRDLLPKEKKLLGVPSRGGLISKETLNALRITTESMIQLLAYIFQDKSVEYVLLGKFQTDPLEARFGQYRQMSGGKYQVSCTQVSESENKLKIISLINLCSNKKGEFKISDLDFNNEMTQKVDIPEHFFQLFNSRDDVEMSDSTMGVIIYIAGYVSYKVCQSISCLYCKNILIRENPLEIECDLTDDFFSYLSLSSRGGLKWPQDIVVDCCVITYQIFVKMISYHEAEFLKTAKPKELLVQLVLEKLEIISYFPMDPCVNNCLTDDLLKQCVTALTNIFLNNYTKVRNDKISGNMGKRKFSTFIQ